MTGPAGPATRIATGLPALLAGVASACGLGEVRAWSVLTTGYEDCNIDLTAERARVVVKVFATDRADGIAARTAEIITRARIAGVRHPLLHHNRDGALVHCHRGHDVLVMDFVHGNTLYDLGRAPTNGELVAILDQALRMHTVDAAPEFVFDPWAIPNLLLLAEQVHDVLDAEQRRLVGTAIDQVTDIDRGHLPVVLIHGDLTKGNVLLAEDGMVHVLDFAVANRFPRVQELAVVAANLTHGSPTPLPARTEMIAELYSEAARVPLLAAERDALRVFTHAAAAMEMLGALAEWHHHGNHSAETEYLIDLGLAGLRDYTALS